MNSLLDLERLLEERNIDNTKIRNLLQEEPSNRNTPFNIHKQSIMVIDDDDSQLISMQKLLENTYKVYLCKDGQKAADMFKKHIYEIKCILLDIRLGNISGFELFEQLKEIHPEIPIIFVTGYQQQYGNGYEIYKKYRPHGYIIKNHENESEMIFNTIQAAIDSYSRFEELQKSKEFELRNQTISGLLHDLKNMFMPIKNLPLILEDALNNNDLDYAKSFLNDLKNIINVYSSIQNVMFNFSKGDKMQLKKSLFNVKSTFEEYQQSMYLQFNKAIKFETSYNYQGNFSTDKTILLFQIILNIIKNSHEAAKGMGSIVSIKLHSKKTYEKSHMSNKKLLRIPEDALIIIISDNCKGVPPHIIDKLFLPYQSFGKINGTGLGTYMIKKGVESFLKGKVEVVNKVGTGLEYQIMLPYLR